MGFTTTNGNMRFPKARRTQVHGNVRWLVRTPKTLGGGREVFETKEAAEKKIAELRKNIGSVAREFHLLPRKAQTGLLLLLEKFDGDIDRLTQAAEDGKRKLVTKKPIADAVKAFNTDMAASERRKSAVAWVLEQFRLSFGERYVHEPEELEIRRWLNDRQWGPKTFNVNLQALRQFWKYCIKSRWTTESPVKEIPSQRVPRSIVPIYDPEELAAMLKGLEARRSLFVPAIAIGAFAGLRITEISRLKWEQVNDGLKTGHLHVEAWQTKTKEARMVPILPNLRIWLEKYCESSGLVLPDKWKNKPAKLEELPKFITRLSGVKWKPNALRHSFGTYRFKVLNDVAQTVDEMGTSIEKFERHYRNRLKMITKEQAEKYWRIVP